MGDVPDQKTLRDTPLVNGHVPSLDKLAERGDLTALPPLEEGKPVNHVNALLSLLGYDLQRGTPDAKELMEYGLDIRGNLTDYESLRPFVIPGFSGHGVCITPSAWVRGVSKCALLRALDVYSPGSSMPEILGTLANLTCEAIMKEEFVLVYVDAPLRASLQGDYESKLRAIEIIDRHLIAPIADFVWKSELMIHMAVTTDLVTPWHSKRPINIRVPVVLYFNNNDWEGDQGKSFTEVEAMLMESSFNHPSDLIRYLSNFNVEEERPESSNSSQGGF